MAADQERADRIRLLKQENPQLKWRHIADHVGVELRSAQMWQETGAISYENAKKLAELVDRDVDWIMRGPRTDTPDMFPPTDDDRIAAMERRITEHLTEQADLIRGLLERQSEILERIEQAVATETAAAETMRDAAETASSLVQQIGADVRSGRVPVRPRESRAAASKNAAKRNPRA